MKHSSFDATISVLIAETSALYVETSTFGAATSAIARRSFDATISALDAETSAIAQSGKVILPTNIDISHMSVKNVC